MACETITDVDLGSVNVASVYRFRFPITKDGVAWTGIDSVAFVFESPDRSTQTTVAAVLETPDAGVWYYDTTVTTLLTEGDWTLGVIVTDGSIVASYPHAVGLHVNDNP